MTHTPFSSEEKPGLNKWTLVVAFVPMLALVVLCVVNWLFLGAIFVIVAQFSSPFGAAICASAFLITLAFWLLGKWFWRMLVFVLAFFASSALPSLIARVAPAANMRIEGIPSYFCWIAEEPSTHQPRLVEHSESWGEVPGLGAACTLRSFSEEELRAAFVRAGRNGIKDVSMDVLGDQVSLNFGCDTFEYVCSSEGIFPIMVGNMTEVNYGSVLPLTVLEGWTITWVALGVGFSIWNRRRRRRRLTEAYALD